MRDPADRNLAPLVALAEHAAREAGDIVLAKFRHAKVSHKAQTYNLVTEADIEAQAAIERRIKDRFPDHAFLGEEQDRPEDLRAAKLWVVDPLDGTNNYAHGIPHFAVSIAYAEAGTVLLGVVLDPMRGELFSCCRGRGATLNGRPIAVSGCDTLDQAMVATGFNYVRDETLGRTLAAMNRLLRAPVTDIRRFGSAALDLCWVACGRFDAYFELRLSPWDYAAAMLLVAEAGGTVSDVRGAPLLLESGNVVASNARLHERFLALVG